MSAGVCLCGEHVNIFVYFTIIYIFIGYFYQGFSRSRTSIFYNEFCVRGSLVCVYVNPDLTDRSPLGATSDPWP